MGSSVIGIVVAFVFTAIPAGVRLGLRMHIHYVLIEVGLVYKALVTIVAFKCLLSCVHNLLVTFKFLETFPTDVTFFCWFLMTQHVTLEKCFVPAQLLT